MYTCSPLTGGRAFYLQERLYLEIFQSYSPRVVQILTWINHTSWFPFPSLQQQPSPFSSTQIKVKHYSSFLHYRRSFTQTSITATRMSISLDTGLQLEHSISNPSDSRRKKKKKKTTAANRNPFLPPTAHSYSPPLATPSSNSLSRKSHFVFPPSLLRPHTLQWKGARGSMILDDGMKSVLSQGNKWWGSFGYVWWSDA